MHDKLNEIYQKMMITENEKMTVGTTKAGELEGANKAKPVEQKKTPDNQVDAPVEGLSQGEIKKGGATANSEAVKGKTETVKDSLNITTSRFEDLYKSVIGEDLDELSDDTDEVVSAPEVEGDEFDDEFGDFGDDSVSDETDIAVELRTMADRLTELADKYAELTGGDELDLDTEGLDDLESDDMGMDEDEPRLESVKSEPEPRVAKATTYGPKMSKTVKGKLATVGKSHAKTGMKGKFTGEPKTLGDKGSKTNQSGMTAKGSGPAKSGKNADLFCK